MKDERHGSIFIVALGAACLTLFGAASTQTSPFREIATIGKLNGTTNDIFGEIRDVGFLLDGRVLALDGQFLQLRAYTADGELTAVVGKGGSGPGELRDPESLFVHPDGSITVLDRGNARISRYITEGEEVRLESDFPIPLQAWSHCGVGDAIYVSGLFGDKAIHQVASNGQIVRSFAEPYDPGPLPEPFFSSARSTLSSGHLECDEQRGLIYWIPDSIGRLYAFTPRGEIAWDVPIPGFLPLRPEMTPRNTMRYVPDERTSSWTIGTGVTLTEGGLVVQVDSLFAVGAENRVHKAFLVDPATGQFVGEPWYMPTVSAAAGPRLGGWRVLPFPHISLWEALP